MKSKNNSSKIKEQIKTTGKGSPKKILSNMNNMKNQNNIKNIEENNENKEITIMQNKNGRNLMDTFEKVGNTKTKRCI